MSGASQAIGSGRKRVLLLGATGTIGRATARALRRAGHDVTCLVRDDAIADDDDFIGTSVIVADPADRWSLEAVAFGDSSPDIIVSCMASRTGAPEDAWAVDHDAHQVVLSLAKQHGAEQMVLLSALCIQQPELAFQRAKLAFEDSLIRSGLTYSIVRPTAFFKSLSGQIERVRSGKPFLLFGDGTLTACKPISDRDLAAFIAGCIDDHARHNAILPVGGPGEAMTLRAQGEMLFELTGQEPRFQSVSPRIFSILAKLFGTMGLVVPPLKKKAALLEIAHYYATHSMLVWDSKAGAYDASATPSYGTDTLRQHYAAVLGGRTKAALGAHAMFDRQPAVAPP
ncbi:MAG: NAD(P)H-binding protein [Pseudomonadota bacterium]